jgi:hypothetical protein
MADWKKDKAKMTDSRKKETTDPVVTAAIGTQLKRLYNQVAEEPVPDRFTRLLEELAKSEGERSSE